MVSELPKKLKLALDQRSNRITTSVAPKYFLGEVQRCRIGYWDGFDCSPRGLGGLMEVVLGGSDSLRRGLGGHMEAVLEAFMSIFSFQSSRFG